MALRDCNLCRVIRLEKTIKRLWTALSITIGAVVLTNIMWWIKVSQLIEEVAS